MSSVNVRVFNGTSDWIQIGDGATGAVDSGYGTFLAVCKRNSVGYNAFFGNRPGSGEGATWEIAPHTDPSPDGIIYYCAQGSPNQRVSPTLKVLNADSWVIAAASKATGTVTPRFHRCLLSGPTWTHEDAAGTLVDHKVGTTNWVIGAYQASAAPSYGDYFGGSIYLTAYWDAQVLSDATIEGLTSLAAIDASSPTEVWVLDQNDVLTPANGRRGLANQTAISGTAVVVDTIPNFESTVPLRSQLSYSKFPKKFMRVGA